MTNSVAVTTTRFKRGNTMHAAVITEGRAATIAARWRCAGRIVNETEQKVSHNDHAAPSSTFRAPVASPLAEYKLEIFLNGQLIETRSLRAVQ